MLTQELTATLAEMEADRLAGKLDRTGLLMLADFYADAGDDDMAAFCRYVPDTPRVPCKTADDFDPEEWTWFMSTRVKLNGYDNERDGPGGNTHFIPHGLPLAPDVDHSSWKRYRSRERAERDLGRVVRELNLV